MKKIYCILITGFLLQITIAQSLSKVSLLRDGQFERVSYDIGENVLIHISKDGQILKWGVDIYAGRDDNYNDRMEEYTGKTGYFAATDDSAFSGKIRFIGRTYITYYSSYENEFLKGKIKTLGNIPFDYYRGFDNEAYRGNIKTAGNVRFSWFRSFDNEALSGKLKSIGPTALDYYSSFDDVAFRGRIKSINRVSYTYYSSFDRPELRGGLKTGAQAILANGVKYYIQW